MKRLATAAAIALTGLLATASPASAVEQIEDGGFEATTCPTPSDGGFNCTNPSWAEVGEQAFVCQSTPGNCTPPAATGSGWGVLGSDLHQTTVETGSLAQTGVEIPDAPATLSFKLRIVETGNSAAAFNVIIDGVVVFSAAAGPFGTPGYESYATVSRDVSDRAAPGGHQLTFDIRCEVLNLGNSCPRFDVDDVSLTTPDPPDADGDGAPDAADNCPETSNPNQADSDGDGVGDLCEAPPPPVPTCNGQPATIVGTDSGENLKGTAGPDVIAALGGNDLVRAGGGPDIVCGGAGRDDLLGQGGADKLLGERGKDELRGGGGKGDVCNGGRGKDDAAGSCEKERAV